jgi:hypothetical protein
MRTISTDGGPLPKTTSSAFSWPGTRDHAAPYPLALELILLLGVGVLAVVLHQSFRIPLRMPGYHGMEWFALLILARLLSNRGAAGMVVGLGAALTACMYAGGLGLDGKSAQILTYLLQGCVSSRCAHASSTALFHLAAGGRCTDTYDCAIDA